MFPNATFIHCRRDLRDIGNTLRWISVIRSTGPFQLYALASLNRRIAIRTDRDGYAPGSRHVRALARRQVGQTGLFRRVALRASLRFSHPVTAAISGGYSTRPLMRGS